MQPADTVTRAASRWLRLLRTSTLQQATGIIRSDSDYTDLTQTQYILALDWIRSLGLVIEVGGSLSLSDAVRDLPHGLAHQLLLERSLVADPPPWLRDADILVPDSTSLPVDAMTVASTLGLPDHVVLATIRHVHGKIDLAERARVGAAGELALLELLECCWPGFSVHVSARDDGFGYDISFTHGREWHLEVKSTVRRGRLSLHLSRHEHEVGLRDRNWRLIVVGLDDSLRLLTVATAYHERILGRAPRDTCVESTWQAVRHELGHDDLELGLGFLGRDTGVPYATQLLTMKSAASVFAWMPN